MKNRCLVWVSTSAGEKHLLWPSLLEGLLPSGLGLVNAVLGAVAPIWNAAECLSKSLDMS